MGKLHIFGRVADGHRLGHKLGFPTANINLNGKFEAKDGVYAGYVYLNGERYGAVINVGRNPSISQNGERRVEAHIIDFNKDIYGAEIEVEFLEYMRAECKFSSLEELAAQIAKDKINAVKIIDNNKTEQNK